MVRAVLEKGTIRPLGPLPEDWREGQRLVIETESEDAAARREEISAWAREIETAAAEIPEEDHGRVLTALEEQRRASKEIVRRQMGLP